MKLPRTIRVGPYDVRVRKLKSDGPERSDMFGCYDDETLTIYVRTKGVHRHAVLETLLHEVGHAISSLRGALGTTLTEEQFVTASTPMFMAVLRDNPKLLKLLCSFCKGEASGSSTSDRGHPLSGDA